MFKAIIRCDFKTSKNYRSYGHSIEQEVFFENEEDYCGKVKYWQAVVRKLVMEEMSKDDIKTHLDK